ncbi:glutathione S-transferase GliG [Talaromyces marneffei ATCC 18224]|uniref:glutathione transferase n=1 Tax=Talaromyces marneffei (strain ATCC 18224 / CBS 334.59 / QM 7333) TaxID=441960 RepID=B6Q4S3_TALMQ|nr:glutathione S-transferase GliG [Talaromyces marneffei ATCC 18224]
MDGHHVSSDRVTLYVKKATHTSGPNVAKLLILLDLLHIPYDYKVLTSPSESEWFGEINPYKMVPAITSLEESATAVLNVFESSACLTFLADKYDREGLYKGKTLAERARVSSWLMAYTAGLGPTGKWWLTLKVGHASTIGNALEILAAAIKKEYSILEARLNEPGQQYIALADRLTIADIAILPFANAQIAMSAQIEFGEYPALKAWSEKVLAMPEVGRAFMRVQTFGHEDEAKEER